MLVLNDLIVWRNLPWGAVATAATLPATRTITATDGRQTNGTVLAMNGDTIKFRRASDGMEFNIALDNLSENDRRWLAGKATTSPAPPRPTPYNAYGGLAIIKMRAPTTKSLDTELIITTYIGKERGEMRIAAGTELNVIRECDQFLIVKVTDQEICVPRPQTGVKTIITSSMVVNEKPLKQNEEDLRKLRQINQATAVHWLQSNDPTGSRLLTSLITESKSHNKNLWWGGKYPSLPSTPADEIIAAMNPKPWGTHESVSLKPELEKMGVKHRYQGDTPSCVLYATANFIEFYSHKGLMRMPEFEQLRDTFELHQYRSERLDKRVYMSSAMPSVVKPYTIKPTTIRGLSSWICEIEFAKHEIRNGRVVITGATVMGNTRHQTVLIGFTSSNQDKGSTKFEAWDSGSNKYITVSDKIEAAHSLAPIR